MDVSFDFTLISGDSKTSYLRRLDNAADKLKLLNADLLDNDAMAAAIAGCQGVFHVATPVPSEKITDPEVSNYIIHVGMKTRAETIGTEYLPHLFSLFLAKTNTPFDPNYMISLYQYTDVSS
jgi:hypothetical protein